jgi:hypothetical protein
VNSDNISYSLDDWQIFKGLCKEYNVDVAKFSSLAYTAWVSNFTGNNVSLLSLIWERGINNNSIEVMSIVLSFFRNVS